MDVIFDIDGTLANPSHRLHFIKKENKDWKSFLSEPQVMLDTAIVPVWKVLESLHIGGNRIIFITGRSEKTRTTTMQWLGIHARENAPQFNFDEHPVVYMRTDGNRSPSEVSKRGSLMEARKDGYNPKLVFEDRDTDTAMWRSERIRCCQVTFGNY